MGDFSTYWKQFGYIWKHKEWIFEKEKLLELNK